MSTQLCSVLVGGAVCLASLSTAACLDPAADDASVSGAGAAALRESRPVRFVSRVRCKETLGTDRFTFDLFDDGEQVVRATLLGRFSDSPPVELTRLAPEQITADAKAPFRGRVVFRDLSRPSAPYFAVSGSIARRVNLSSPPSSTESITIVDESGFSRSATCLAERPFTRADDARAAVERILPLGSHRGRTPAGDACAVVVEHALPIAVTPEMDDTLKQFLTVQREELVVRIVALDADGSSDRQSSFFTVGAVPNMLASVGGDVLYVDSEEFDHRGLGKRRTLIVDRKEGSNASLRVATGSEPADDALDICDTGS